ncbi:hypothetical protein [Nannocystis bainbridge]|uniref:DUF4259 domain-containing protein n=1 Tax=Nannocystis bainbridge TaxID=2995303 RepID=A0ABT5E024_9BACT|nr:hypothetical protein [Nannocystis bainbridge]MDC0719231.1 hypothetical protein [Nannocystis bainbridge]
MGTWDDGLYDNDSALDLVGRLVKLPALDAPPSELVVGIGLVAWLQPVVLKLRGAGHVEAALAHGEALPADAREVLAGLARDLEGGLAVRSRSAAAKAALGGYNNGTRFDALLRVPGGQAGIDALGERAGEVLDGADDGDLYEAAGDFAALGVIVELVDAGLWKPAPARVAEWRARFERADAGSREEREFWDSYAARVRLGFDLVSRA